jgi:predicted ribosomally synthesized peptide with nif11-like leader
MSIDNVKAFFEKVQQDESLQDKLKAIREDAEKGESGLEAAADEVVGIASGAGFDFTREDLLEARQMRTDELSDEQLDTVSGGMPCIRNIGMPF